MLVTVLIICFRLYETQVKKIVKVQCMMRAFLAKRNVKGKIVARQASLRQQSMDSAQGDSAGVTGNDEIESRDQGGEEGDDNETAVVHDEADENIEEEHEPEEEQEEEEE